MIKSELCSVIMPAYNSEKYIADSIRSVLNQTYKNLELIIVDDFSSDATKEIIETFAEQDIRIKVISNSINLGCAAARNRAIASSAGKYIAFLDSDDIWVSNKLENEIEEINQQQCDLIYTAYEMIDSDNKVIKHRLIPQKATMDLLLKENFICFSSVLIKMEFAKKFPMSSTFFHEDYCYLLSLFKDGVRFWGINKMLVQYRVSAQNRSSNKIKAAKYRWLIYRKHLQLSLYDSSRYFISYFFNGLKKYYT